MTRRQPGAQTRRIEHLDGLRGLAALMVVFYHSYVRWPEFMPFGGRFAHSPLRFGPIGVELFFLISGYVILMTLRRCSSFGEFLKRRWLRLFPAMLVCAIVEFAIWQLVPLSPHGQPTLLKAVPGLTLIDDRWFSWALGRPVGVLEGVYWTLFVEARFYIMFGLAYFAAGAPAAIALMVLATAFRFVAGAAGIHLPAIVDVLDFGLLAWFAAGSLFYLAVERGSRMLSAAAFLVGALAALALSPAWGPRVVSFFMVVLFGAALHLRPLQRLLGIRIALFFGAISYPLYLVHENLIIALVRRLAGGAVPGLLLPLPGLVLAVALAWAIARFAEPFTRAQIERLFRLRRPRGALDTHGQPPTP